MQHWTTQFEWSFPLGIPGVIIALAAAIALSLFSYRFTPRPVKAGPRTALVIIRFLFFATLVFCLCRPTIAKKQTLPNKKKKTVAVLIDESSSMASETLLGTTRFEKAKAYWNRNLAPHADRYAFRLYQFGQGIRPVEEFKPRTPQPFIPTQLYRNIAEWNGGFPAQDIDGVICMTDGIDTSGSPSDDAVDALMNTALPHVFVPIATAVAGPPFAIFRKVEVEPAAKLHTRIPVTIVTATSGAVQGEKTVLTVTEGPTEIHRTEIASSGGNVATRTHTFDLEIDRPGTHRYQARITAGKTLLAQTEWSVQGSENDAVKVLLYQGGLDWGTRYLRGVFDRDPRSELTVAFAPNAFPAQMVSQKKEYVFPSMDVLSPFDVVIVLKMREEQIADEMDDTLREFVSTGGSLLFIIANSLDAQSYVGSPLEAFLPVEFDSLADPAGHDEKTARFLETMDAYRNTASTASTALSTTNKTVETMLDAPPLHPFQLTEEGRRNPVFSYLLGRNAEGSRMPEFQDFALVRKSKPGARVLAVHPELSSRGGERRILMAQQAFGKGQVAVLATDPLWRWKLSSDSRDASYDEFWKGLMAWLGAGRIHATYWDLPSRIPAPGTPAECDLHISLRSGVSPKKVRATITDLDANKPVPLPLAATDRATRYTATFIPAAGKTYRLRALNGETPLTESILSCPSEGGHKELQELKPDIKALSRLAASSFQHTLVQPGQPHDWIAWLPDQLDENDLCKTEHPLWHKRWIFMLMLTLFLGEMLIRRWCKLV